MTLASRLGRLAPALSAKERAILPIRSEVAGETPDPELSRSMPSEQSYEFRKYLALYYVANAEMGTVALSLYLQVYTMFQVSRLSGLLKECAQATAEQLGDQLRNEKLRRRRGKRDSVTMPQYLLDLSNEVVDIQWDMAATRWQEIAALEIVWQEICDEFDGEDVVHPEKRGHLTEAKQTLLDLFNDGPRRKWPAPAEGYIEAYRKHVEEVLHMWRLVTPS